MPTGKANRGEWGEPYVVLKVLGDGKIFMSDDQGRKNPNEWMNILEVIRHETLERIVIYHYDPENTVINIDINGIHTASIPAREFMIAASRLAADILTATGRTFAVSDDLKNFLQYKAYMQHLKARSTDKNDIYMTVSDPRTSIVRNKIGFSIKTKFGQNPTLFNTAPASGARYKIFGMTEKLMEYINAMVDVKGHAAITERCNKILDNNCSLQFVGFPIARRAGCEAFRENLDLINPRLPDVIAAMLYNHFFENDNDIDISAITKKMIKKNPCNILRPEMKYPHMIKSFLYAAYCGMTASTLWDGKGEVNGGFITVTKDGDVIANYALESEAFKSYLFNNCYLEFPSTNSSHGDYARVYKEDGEYYFNLNFQIRYR